MHLTVKGHHIEITPAMHDYVNQKFGKAWRHFDHVNEVHVVLGVEKLNQIAEVTVRLPGKDIHCEASHTDMYAAISRTSSTARSSGTRKPTGPGCTAARPTTTAQ